MKRTVCLALLGSLAAVPALAQEAPGAAQNDAALAALQNDEAVVRQIEQTLQQEGYLQDADGRFDDRTREALSRFQTERAIHVSGQIDHDTLAALGIETASQQSVGEDRPTEQSAEAEDKQSSQVPKPDVAPDLRVAPPLPSEPPAPQQQQAPQPQPR